MCERRIHNFFGEINSCSYLIRLHYINVEKEIFILYITKKKKKNGLSESFDRRGTKSALICVL